jgi:hypothetical protein
VPNNLAFTNCKKILYGVMNHNRLCSLFVSPFQLQHAEGFCFLTMAQNLFTSISSIHIDPDMTAALQLLNTHTPSSPSPTYSQSITLTSCPSIPAANTLPYQDGPDSKLKNLLTITIIFQSMDCKILLLP